VPNGNNSPRVLRGGEFYSPVTSSLRTDEVLLSELRQPCARQMPRHEHALAYFTIVLRGHYAEEDGHCQAELHPFTALFNPVGVAHRSLVGSGGATLFTIELRADYLEQLQARLPKHPVTDSARGEMLWPGLRLYSAFKAQCADSLVLESCVLEMLGALEERPMRQSPPPWFRRVKERLHEEFRENLRMHNLASDAGVHPVHLARTFRTQEKQTAGNYLQRLRVRLLAVCCVIRSILWPPSPPSAASPIRATSHVPSRGSRQPRRHNSGARSSPGCLQASSPAVELSWSR
jgi:AraC family transcriptional regulator